MRTTFNGFKFKTDDDQRNNQYGSDFQSAVSKKVQENV